MVDQRVICGAGQESELQEEAALVAFWQAAGAAGDLADGICTPREVGLSTISTLTYLLRPANLFWVWKKQFNKQRTTSIRW